MPTYRRVILFLALVLLPISGLLDPLPPLKVFFGLPRVFIADYAVFTIVQIIYSYALACLYAAAYASIEGSLRKSYPHMSYAAWRKRRMAVARSEPKRKVKKPAAKPRRRKKR